MEPPSANATLRSHQHKTGETERCWHDRDAGCEDQNLLPITDKTISTGMGPATCSCRAALGKGCRAKQVGSESSGKILGLRRWALQSSPLCSQPAPRERSHGAWAIPLNAPRWRHPAGLRDLALTAAQHKDDLPSPEGHLLLRKPPAPSHQTAFTGAGRAAIPEGAPGEGWQRQGSPELALEGADLAVHGIRGLRGVLQLALQFPTGRVGPLGLLLSLL